MPPEEKDTVQVPILVAERIVSSVTPDACPWCRDDIEAAGSHKDLKQHKILCPVKALSAILDARPRQ